MNPQTLTAELPRPHRRPRWWPRLVSAEFLKLRKRRGLVAAALAVTVAPITIALPFIVSDDDGQAGGMANFVALMDMLSLLSVVAAILVGATLGTGDLGAGVFRELVVTGRSRLALFAARLPAGLGLLVPIVGAAFAIVATASTVHEGTQQTQIVHGNLLVGNVAPSGSILLQSAGWLALVTVVSFALALGVSSLLRSRGTSIGVLLGWWLVAMPVLFEIGGIGSARKGLIYAAAERLRPEALFEGGTAGVPMSLTAAVVVLLVWTAVPLALGMWRTCTRDA